MFQPLTIEEIFEKQIVVLNPQPISFGVYVRVDKNIGYKESLKVSKHRRTKTIDLLNNPY